MSVPAPIQLGSTSSMVFLLAQESGILIDSFSRKTGSKQVQAYDATQGGTTGEVYHDFNADYDIKGKIILTNNATTGLATASPGVVATVANVTTGNGVTSGGVYGRTTSLDHTAEQLREFTATFKQYPGIT